ncbi:MAG: DUF2066 domain-containing protein [Chitinophagales bacterium]|nr:DUF2066 domain-containing protein [Hyphomicrobiales bacterium]
MFVRLNAALLVFAALAAISTVRAEPVLDLYRAATPVTGVGEAERLRGFRSGLEEVIIRLTGDASLKGAYRIEPILDFALSFVQTHNYTEGVEDRLKPDDSGMSQPTHTLTVEFDKAKLNSAIEAFGLTIWSSDRPLTAVFLSVKDRSEAYVLTKNNENALYQRGVLNDIALRRGAPIVLPTKETLSAISYETVSTGDTDALTAAAKSMGADAVLFGALEFDGDAYWSVNWTLIWFGHDIQTWEIRGVHYPVAIREAVEKSAKLYSAFATR